MLYKANPTGDAPVPLEGKSHPEDTERAVSAIRNIIYRDKIEATEAKVQEYSVASETAKREKVAEVEAEAARTAQAAKPSLWSRWAPKGQFQPDWRISAAILVLAVFVWKPFLIPGFLLLSLAIGAIVYFSLGPDRVGEGAARWHRRVQRRNPLLAERVRGYGNRAARRMERWTGYLPERWTQGLYFPTFEEDRSDVEEEKSNPFDRLVPQDRL